MSYAELGVYDRREQHQEKYPSCATAAEKAAAHSNCHEVVLRGLGGKIAGLGATDRFAGANPCWVETLPTCPTCLTLAQAWTYAAQIKSGKTLSDPIAALPYCSSVPVPAVPKCLPAGSQIGNPPGYDLIQYCRKAGGTDPAKNAACYLIMRAPSYWSKVASVGVCRPPPKLSSGRTTKTATTTARKPPTLTSTRASAPAPAPAPAPGPAPGPGPAPQPMPQQGGGLSTGSILLIGAAVGGGVWLWKRSRKPS